MLPLFFLFQHPLFLFLEPLELPLLSEALPQLLFPFGDLLFRLEASGTCLLFLDKLQGLCLLLFGKGVISLLLEPETVLLFAFHPGQLLLLLVQLALLVVVFEDLVEHVLPDAYLELLLVLPQLILSDGLGLLLFAFLVLLLRHNVLLENLTCEEAGALAGHGLNPGNILVGDFPWAQLAEIVVVLLDLQNAPRDNVFGAIQD